MRLSITFPQYCFWFFFGLIAFWEKALYMVIEVSWKIIMPTGRHIIMMTSFIYRRIVLLNKYIIIWDSRRKSFRSPNMFENVISVITWRGYHFQTYGSIRSSFYGTKSICWWASLITTRLRQQKHEYIILCYHHFAVEVIPWPPPLPPPSMYRLG